MASIKFTGLVLGIRGSIAGSTFQGSKTGFTVKSKQAYKITVPKYTQGAALFTYKNVYQYTSQFWRKLTEVERETWITAASSFPAINKWGDTYTPSGYQLYISFTVNLLLIGLYPPTTAPTPYSFSEFSFVSVDDITTTLMQLNLSMSTDTQVVIEVRASTCISRGSRSPRGGLKFINYYSGSSGSLPNIIEDYLARYSSVINNTRVVFAIRLVNRDSGQYTAWQYNAGHVTF